MTQSIWRNTLVQMKIRDRCTKKTLQQRDTPFRIPLTEANVPLTNCHGARKNDDSLFCQRTNNYECLFSDWRLYLFAFIFVSRLTRWRTFFHFFTHLCHRARIEAKVDLKEENKPLHPIPMCINGVSEHVFITFCSVPITESTTHRRKALMTRK